MPIIPSNWTGSVAVNAIGIGGGSGSTSYAYANSLNATITELDTFIDLVGVCDEPISREVSLDLISGKVKLYWKGLDNSYTQIQIFTRQSGDALVFTSGYNFVDLTLGQLGLSIKCSELTEISLVLRWDKDIEFDLYSEPVPPVVVPDLITVINNVIHIDETLGLAITDPVACVAYFPDNVGAVTGDWQKLYLADFSVEGSITNSPWFRIWVYSGFPDYISTFAYPTQFNPYTFEITSDYIQYYVDNLFPLTATFKMAGQWGDNDPIYQDVNIVSYDKTTNTFILGLV